MRGRPLPEVRLPIPAVAIGRAHWLKAQKTEAKVMRPNVCDNRRTNGKRSAAVCASGSSRGSAS